MTNKIHILLAAIGLMLMFTSCDPEVAAVSGRDVKIDIHAGLISSGFMQFTFTPNMEGYYHVGIVPAEEAPDSTRSASIKSFMALQLDRAYAEYMDWRVLLLAQNVQPVAEFPTHSLQYGAMGYNFTMLKPDTKYMVYAFPVNAKTNKPDGRLFTYFVSTEPKSSFEDLEFEYRVRGYWDYVYPVHKLPQSDLYELMSFVPWVDATVDSLSLVEYNYESPKTYFNETFEEYVLYKERDRIHFGIDVRNNNGFNSGTSTTVFLPGHTYYTGLTLMDGYLSQEALTIYKFRWENDSTQYFFTDSLKLATEW